MIFWTHPSDYRRSEDPIAALREGARREAQDQIRRRQAPEVYAAARARVAQARLTGPRLSDPGAEFGLFMDALEQELEGLPVDPDELARVSQQIYQEAFAAYQERCARQARDRIIASVAPGARRWPATLGAPDF